MVQSTVLFLVLICTILHVEGYDCDATKCPRTPKHYAELGCTHIKDANQCCAERFDCPAKKELGLGQCDFKNITYEARDKIPARVVKDACSAECYCDFGRITCANVECPEYFNYPDRSCILQHRDDMCCASNVICDETQKAKLATCEFEGETYRGGQSMYSDVDKCIKCTCEEGFDGKLDYKSCGTVSCGIELHYGERLRGGCVPIYYGEDGCCPIGWRCPESKDALAAGIHKSKEDSALECRFGNLTLLRGDSLTPGTDRCTTCTCKIPPMVSCITDPVCYERGT